MPFDLSTLNEEQLKPVTDTEGAVLVTAGAGSGKTRLLTHRIAHLVVDLNVKPYNILAITFTNKAAREMKERLAHMISGAGGLKVSTIHSLCVTILRSFAHLIGFSADFSIYDEDERKKVIKKAANEVDSNDEMLIERATAALNSIKNIGMDIDEYAAIHKYLPFIENVKKTVISYTRHMRENNALDFDDLLLYAYEVIRAHAEAMEYYQNLFRYIHVDEFQDTNVIQYKLIKLLAGKWGNVFVVGDEDQSIYGWRGADIANIRSFISDFNCRVYKLEQNYRSTKSIIKIANEVIKNNTTRIEKQLWTSNDEGDMPVIFNPDTDSDEADYIMQCIKSLNRNGMAYSDIAVLMRINSLSRSIEQKFLFYGIPYKLYGGFKFYDRKEVKDILAYLKAAVNPFDDEAATRILQFPKKGIGDASISKMTSLSRAYGLSLMQMLLLLNEEAPDERNLRQTLMYELSPALTKKLIPLSKTLRVLSEGKNQKVSELLKLLYELIDIDGVFSDGSEESESRLMNIGELISSVVQTEQSNPEMTLSNYVQQIMLYSEGDDAFGSDSVNVATIHSAKGLEFKAVFVIGLEDKIFPLSRSMDEPESLEEERRLMYVALTRARQRLYLTYTRRRFLYGKHSPSIPSRFLFETGLIKKQPKTYEFSETGGYQNDYNYSAYNGRGGYNSSGYNSYDKGNNSNSAGGGYKPKTITSVESLGKPIKGTIEIEQLKVGQRISHKRLGEGTVKSINIESNEADIAFDSMGVVTLAINLAPITLLK